ncbi:putative T7SS-secreted protein [Streptomyces sp. AM8-1-1]|uniref:putative T7SS-secreted protein n=1 Tax=Streptomyces sp. AM8-1-1 TaxID=3075825 RepID=UPI0039B6EADE
MTPAPDYPHLGWNPVPGNPSAVSTLQTKLTSSAEALGTAHRLVSELLGQSSFWRGEAADAFRAAIDGELPRYLKNAHRSVSKAAKQLGRWHDDLVSYQATARRYDTQAKLDTAAITKAEAHHDLLRAAASTPEPELRAAAESVTKAREALASVRKLARELEDAHGAEAGRIAKGLNEATERLAPKEPGALDRFLKWVDEDLGDLLSDISAGAGFLALVLGPVCAPLGLALLFVATGASIGALALHATDSRIHKSLKDGFTKGKFDADFWDSTVTLTGDALGSVPGVAAIAHGAKSASAAVHAGGAVADAGAMAAMRAGSDGFAGGAKTAMDDMRRVENPLTGWALQSTPVAVKESVKYGLPAAGAATAVSHYTPLDDNETFANSATGADGFRAVVDDGPSSGAKLAQAWTSLVR